MIRPRNRREAALPNSRKNEKSISFEKEQEVSMNPDINPIHHKEN